MNEQQKKIYQLIKISRIFDEKYYLQCNPDVAKAKIDPLTHYIVAGDVEGRNPSQFFNTSWYRHCASMEESKANALAHYILIGEKKGLQPIVGLDPAYVRQQIPTRSGLALVSFIEAKHFKRHLNPNPFFDYDFYTSKYPDVLSGPLDPYLHFIANGAAEGRIPSSGFSWHYVRERFNLEGSNCEVFSKLMANWRRLGWTRAKGETSVVMMQEEVRENHRPSAQHEVKLQNVDRTSARDADIYAFYLPQFHRIPENDEWWGAGFTEWHNVVRGVPRFQGHYQPRIPADLGFYDLSDTTVMRRQVEMARQAGLSGFAFYYYHFGEKRLLEKPLNAFRGDHTMEFGYFLIWANETWSRRWDGSEKEVLLEQTYPEGLLEELAADFSHHFADRRYRTIDGRPLLVIYRISQLPNPSQYVKLLREAIKKRGFDPVIYLAQSFDDLDPKTHGLDGALEFPPHKLSRDMKTISPNRVYEKSPDLRIYDYGQFVEKAVSQPTSDFPLIRTCFPSWDNDGRRQGASSVVHASTPQKFAGWLEHLVNEAESLNGHPGIVCINAWNEWGEGAYLEPDRRFGYAYLNAVTRTKFPDFKSAYGKVALVSHDAFQGGAQRLLLSIGRTLKEKFGTDVCFVILRADAGYDTLLPEYRRVATTLTPAHGNDQEMRDVALRLKNEGFKHAIVNTSAAAGAVSYFDAKTTSILLVHELENMLRECGGWEALAEVGGRYSRVIAPTLSIAELVKKASPEIARKVSLIPQGLYKELRTVDRDENNRRLASFLGMEHRPKVVVGIGYADRRKGIDIFLDACQDLNARAEKVLFIWQGDWDPVCRMELGTKIDELYAAGCLLLVPNHEYIEEVLAAADAFFLSSREDPLPTVAFEAWHFGLPLVCIRGTGGIAEIVAKNSALGTVVREASVSAITRAIRKTLQPENRSPKAVTQRKDWVARNCDWTRYVQSLLSTLYKMPSLDIAIIGHNHGKFAAQRISSVHEQTYPANRITYYDVGSSDGSQARVAELLDNFYRGRGSFVALPPNEGRLASTWLQVVKESSAKYIHIGEGDDWVEHDFLERCVNQLEKHSKAAFTFTAVSWCDEDGKTITPSHAPYTEEILGEGAVGGGYLSPGLFLQSSFLQKNPILSLSSTLWNRKKLLQVLEKNIAKINRANFAFDWLLYYSSFAEGYGAVYVPAPLTAHRQHSRSMSSSTNVSHQDEIARIQTIFKNF